MATGRIRSIKPTFPKDETLGACSRDARLLFVSLWSTCCDDYGKFRAAPALLRGEVFPYDEDLSLTDLSAILLELERAGRIRLYEAGGQQYGLVVNWAKHQRIDNAGRSDFPDPPDSPQLAVVRGGSPLERKGEERKGKETASHDAYQFEFNEIYAAYPLKREPKKALAAYVARRREGIDHEILLTAVSHYAQSREGQDPKFTKYPATFLGPSEVWRDFVDGVPDPTPSYAERDPEYVERSLV